MNRNLFIATLLIFACLSIILLTSCAKEQMIAEEKETKPPSKEVAKVEKENQLVKEEEKEGGFKVDIQALVHETQKTTQNVNEIVLAWWTPDEYWRAVFAQNPMMAEAGIEEAMKVFRSYMFIAVVDGKMGAFGGITYKSEANIRSSIFIKDSHGTVYPPISEDKIDINAKNFLSATKPILANALGPLGQNLHFFLFPTENKKGQKIAEAKSEGAFSVKIDEKEFRWKLPLGSILPPKICPSCGEKLSGAYKYCPWDGTKLQATN
jgi:hypothetical protein